MKRRLDAALVHRGLVRSRNQAQELIDSDQVLINGIVVNKSSSQVSDDVKIEIDSSSSRDVGRGAEKLRNALSRIANTKIENQVCFDIGAATGGFTQILLENNAAKVYAIDVGYGQMAWSLRQDPRVAMMERCNARNLTENDFSEKGDFLVADVSFISLTMLVPAFVRILKPEAQLLLMVKPQFELERNEISSGGVVKDLSLREKAVWKVINSAREYGLECDAIAYSGLAGPSGNKEFFIKLGKSVKAISADAVRQEIERAGI
jgi:23S rRNA (cytidine1920-2'-O)/16S rRNA (cytidine1409-2'-O)-methyltransferase